MNIKLTYLLVLFSDGVEKQPLAIVGSPYWMAPEVLRGELYNERVKISLEYIVLYDSGFIH